VISEGNKPQKKKVVDDKPLVFPEDKVLEGATKLKSSSSSGIDKYAYQEKGIRDVQNSHITDPAPRSSHNSKKGCGKKAPGVLNTDAA
jgi:hypothetical protein